MKTTISLLFKTFERLVQNDKQEYRVLLSEACSKLLNQNFTEYKKLPVEVQDIIDDLSVMDEIDGRKEPKIIHMSMKEAKQLLDKLKKLYQLFPKI